MTMISDQTRTFIDGIAEPVIKAELLHALATLEGIKAGATGDLRATEFSRAFDKSVEGYQGAITNQHASIDRLLVERRESIRSIHTLNQSIDAEREGVRLRDGWLGEKDHEIRQRDAKILELAAEVTLLTKQTNDLRSYLDTERNTIHELEQTIAQVRQDYTTVRAHWEEEKRWRETRGQLPADEERATRQLLEYNADANIKIRNLEREVARLKAKVIDFEGAT